MHTDCMAYMRSLPDKFFDLAIADPPYGTADVKAHDPRGRYGTRFNKYPDLFNAASFQRKQCSDYSG